MHEKAGQFIPELTTYWRTKIFQFSVIRSKKQGAIQWMAPLAYYL